ncbi:MAG: hypothetical protein WC928_04170 [Patescibacteria group bacterium]|jgi:hypothetical protein
MAWTKEKINTWMDLLKKIGVIDTYMSIISKREINDMLSRGLENKEYINYTKNNPFIWSVLPIINEFFAKNPEEIKSLKDVFEAYNSISYSLEKSKSIILESLEKKLDKHSPHKIPIIYTTYVMPTQYLYDGNERRELYAINSFNIKDYGRLDFLEAILELKNKNIINISSFELSTADSEKITFKLTLDYKKYKKRITKKIKMQQNKKDIKHKVEFDPDESKLFIDNKKINIQKFSDQYHLLKTIFENKKEIRKEWFFSEIGEKVDAEQPNPNKKYSNATYQIKIKIAIDIGIKDFFITTGQSLKINNRYLSLP